MDSNLRLGTVDDLLKFRAATFPAELFRLIISVRAEGRVVVSCVFVCYMIKPGICCVSVSFEE